MENPPTRLPALSPSEIIDFCVSRMMKAVEYLQSRDIDEDGLLKQDHNEDWMDSVLRAGKIVYSQAYWIMALTNLSSLLSIMKKDKEASNMWQLAKRTISAVEKELWSDEEGTYIDKQESHHLSSSPYKTLTQDVSLYLVATAERTVYDRIDTLFQENIKPSQSNMISRGETLSQRANGTLDAIKSRIWKEKWPLVSEAKLETSGPWVLDPNVYHNHTFWPWITGIEILARSRYSRLDECATLLSSLTRVDRRENLLAYYEWVSPITGEGRGAYPFRTGISSIRNAITEMPRQLEEKDKSPADQDNNRIGLA